MKYSKDAVVDRVRTQIEHIKRQEREQHAYRVAEHRKHVAQQRESRKKIADAVDQAKEWLTGLETSDEENQVYKAIEHLFGKQLGLTTRFGTSAFDYAAADYPEPVLDSSKSDELEAVLTVFLTGAPPEVSVNDLKGFGLMNLVRFGRL